MPFGVGRGMGVLDGGGDRRREWWKGTVLGRPIVTNGDALFPDYFEDYLLTVIQFMRKGKQSFPGQDVSRNDVSRTDIFPDRRFPDKSTAFMINGRFPDRTFPGQTFPGQDVLF